MTLTTTLAALQSGSITYKWVVAIEGYSYLITDATASQATTAWSGTDWSSALTGLVVEMENEQRINPWEQFGSGGRCSLYVLPDADDTFGIDTHRKTAGAETLLEATIDSNDTTLTVRDTTSFASSGTLYCGTETIAYSGKTSTTFTGATRGKFAPFAINGGTRFGRPHTVGVDPNAVRLQPVVSEQPRIWIGRSVGVWMHQYDAASGTLNTKANAQLVYAGRIVEIRDDPSTMATLVELEHVLDHVREFVLGTDLWSANIADGIYLKEGDRFDLVDQDNFGAVNAADPLIVTATPSGVNEIGSGFQSTENLFNALNAWFAAELNASRILGTYFVAQQFTAPPAATDSGLRTIFFFRIPGTGPNVQFTFAVPPAVNKFLGELPWGSLSSLGQHQVGPNGYAEDDVDYSFPSIRAPKRVQFDIASSLAVTDERGTFASQLGTVPPFAAPPGQVGQVNGIFLVAGKYLISGDKSGDEITNLQWLNVNINAALPDIEAEFAVSLDDPNGTVEIRQILFYETTTASLLKRLFYSTGTTSYNHVNFDTLPRTLSLGIPHDLLGTGFLDSCDELPLSDQRLTLRIDKPKKLIDAISGDLQLRWSFLRWKSGGLQLSQWSTPTTGDSFTESNKAFPSGNSDNQRSAAVLSDDWVRSVIKINHGLDVTDLEGKFRDLIVVEDRVAIDDAGGASKVRTIDAANVYRSNFNIGPGMEELKDYFISLAPMFTRPVRRMSRTIDSRFFEGYSVGDTVLVTDEFARDPDTGRRGVAIRPAVIVMHRWSPGGPLPSGNGVSDINGEVELMLQDRLAVAPYVPCAQVDDTSTNGGYVVGTKVLTCYAHKHSESSEAADASHFSAGRAIRLIEIDPEDPVSPSMHDDVVASQTGNTITLTTGFAGWDNTKLYRVVFDDYADSTAGQQAGFVYQADDVDGMVQDDRFPFEYLSVVSSSSFTANDPADQVELPPDASYGDGVGRDVGHEAALNRLVTNLVDYKTAHSSPLLTQSMDGSSTTGDFRLVEIRPIHLTNETRTTTANRYLFLAPMMKCIDASPPAPAAEVRVTLARGMPSGSSLDDVNLGTISRSVTFTSTSTTFETAVVDDLAIGAIPSSASGNAFLLIECSSNAETLGLAVCREGPRDE